jgi:hypothetical protein
MDTSNLPAENTSSLPVPQDQCQRHPSIWSVPLGSAPLWWTRNVAPALVLWIPVFPRAYLLVTRMSSWNFVVLSFLLLLLGALMSLFLKQKLLPEGSVRSDPVRQEDNSQPQS